MTRTRWVSLLATLAVATLATGCRESEQSRPLDFRPHMYLGQKPPPLTEQQRRELQERGNLQR